MWNGRRALGLDVTSASCWNTALARDAERLVGAVWAQSAITAAAPKQRIVIASSRRLPPEVVPVTALCGGATVTVSIGRRTLASSKAASRRAPLVRGHAKHAGRDSGPESRLAVAETCASRNAA